MRLLQMSAPASAELVADLVAQHLEDVTHKRAAGAFLLPTGATPLPLYAELRKRAAAGKLDLDSWHSFNLDEYWPCDVHQPASFYAFMQREFFGPAEIPADRTHCLSGDCAEEELAAHCASYEGAMKAAGGIALAVVGIGTNGHLAFNEPGTEWSSRTRLVELSLATRQRPSFPGGLDGPRQALTVGLATILDAQHLVLLAQGAAKAEAVFEMMQGEPSFDWPATCLQNHAQVTVLADAEACALLT